MLAWVNGALVPQESATVRVMDRGFLFGDGVYELVRFFGGVGAAMDLHEDRLARSCALAGIDGFDARTLRTICAELLRANGLRDASVYLQVTRGAGAARAHMPAPGLVPTRAGMLRSASSTKTHFGAAAAGRPTAWRSTPSASASVTWPLPSASAASDW